MSASSVMPESECKLPNQAYSTEHSTPVRTRSVDRPPFWPNNMSVFSRSPIIIVRSVSKLILTFVSKRFEARVVQHTLL